MKPPEVRELHHRVIFVSGALRSGTTLLKLILDNHSQISNPGEFDFLFDQITDDGALPDIDSYKEWLTGRRIFLAHKLKFGLENDIPTLLSSFIRQLETKNSELVLNVHRGFHKIPAIFPNARYIHLLRDPRDVGLSSIKMGWSGNAYYGVDHWIETEVSWNRLSSQLNNDQFIELKYEDLVSSPQNELQKICQFLNLEFEQQMLDFSNTSTYGEINQDSLYRWKNELGAEEKRAIEYKISDLLGKKGYEIQSDTSRKPKTLVLIKFAIQNRLSKWKFRHSRYGTRLFLMDKFARVFSLTRLSKSLRVEQNEINKKFLK